MSAVTTDRQLAFVGLGNMGAPMVAQLVAGGFAVTVYDLDADAVERAVAAGASPAGSVAAAAAAASIVITSLPTPGIVEEVVAGTGGVLSALAPGGAVVDMSTIDPATAVHLHERSSAAGVAFLDAPVSGGVARAHDGTLTIMVGGDADVLERCRPALACLGEEIVHVGGPGAGQMTKLCNNVLCAVILAGMAESFAAGRKAGLDRDTLADVVRHSSGANWLLEHWLPATTFAGDYTARFALDLMHKDVGLFVDAARELDVPAPVVGATARTLALAREQGLGSLDMTVLMRLAEERAGLDGAEA